jgi:hypothetical protein
VKGCCTTDAMGGADCVACFAFLPASRRCSSTSCRTMYAHVILPLVATQAVHANFSFALQVHSEHDSKFYQLMRQVEKECTELDWTSSHGAVVGGSRAALDADTSSRSGRPSGHRLGGGSRGTSRLLTIVPPAQPRPVVSTTSSEPASPPATSHATGDVGMKESEPDTIDASSTQQAATPEAPSPQTQSHERTVDEEVATMAMSKLLPEREGCGKASLKLTLCLVCRRPRATHPRRRSTPASALQRRVHREGRLAAPQDRVQHHRAPQRRQVPLDPKSQSPLRRASRALPGVPRLPARPRVRRAVRQARAGARRPSTALDRTLHA